MSPDARAGRERKQKIFVVVGGLFLVVLLAVQLPKLLGGSGGAEAAGATTTTTAAATATGEPTPASAAVSVARQPAVAEPQTAKLTSFGAFQRKDPFVQQVTPSDLTGAPTTGSTSGSESAAGGDKAGSSGKDTSAAPAESKKFSLGGKGTAAPTVTVVSVNGDRQALQAGARFPSTDPVFVLVSEHPESKSVEVGVVGGAYSGGSKTTKLVVGKPLTLVNTATGARYRLVLVAVGSGNPTEKQPAASSK